MFYFGALLVIAMVIAVGLWTAKKGKEKYDNSRNASSWLVSGALIGTLVGGSSTIGTAQLAYTYGFSAWWFTLGGGIGVLLLGMVFAKPLFHSNVNTLADIIQREYGKKNGWISALLSSIGTFLSFIAQIISGTALIMTVTDLNFLSSIMIVAVLMVIYVFWGGALGLGYSGIVKTLLLAATVVVCGLIALHINGGFESYWDNDQLQRDVYFNLFARGITTDLGAGVSLVVGVITTQSYISAILMARSLKEAKRGTYLTAVIVPLLGVFSVFVGMYMRLHYPNIDTKLALPMFIMQKMPPVVSGMMLASMLVAVTGTGAGLSFGMASTIYRNIYKQIKPAATVESSGRVIRFFLLAIILLGSILCYLNFGDLILSWSFLSMGLRGAASFLPLIFALFLPGRVDGHYAIMSMIGGVGFTFVGKMILPPSIDPLFLGILASSIIMLFGWISKGVKEH